MPLRRRAPALLLGLLACACGSTSGSGPTPTGNGRSITVFAAASLSRVMPQEITAFGSGRVQGDYEGTQSLLTKLEADASLADVFISADRAHMETAVSRGLVEQPQNLAFNRLVIAVPPGNPAHISGLADLARPGVRISLADTSVPAGKYAEQSLLLAESHHDVPTGFAKAALANVATRQTDVETVVSDVAVGAVDAGIVYASDAHGNSRITALPIATRDQPPTVYLVAVVAHAHDPAAARAFVDFLLSAEGQRVLAVRGFIPVAAASPAASP